MMIRPMTKTIIPTATEGERERGGGREREKGGRRGRKKERETEKDTNHVQNDNEKEIK